ncbi:hypothetical protein [Sinorhizobium meliloti]|uniref:hypothetical protein n=1 Tax=Rhizobium meliloti TaxID=382 RepID=UPI001F422525|nr:hypothetical protein [Sinorhizobium meliloti]
MLLAAGGVGLINALGDGLAAAREARYQARYDAALDTAITHAEQMQAMVRAALETIAKLEAENKSLRAACQQRQEVINVLKTRGRA